jgi:Stage III sporulation protein AE (spore_III_AE).
MKRILCCILAAGLLGLPVFAEASISDFDFDEQLDALGARELEEQLPAQASELLQETGLRQITVESLLELSPKAFFSALWEMVLQELRMPAKTLGILVGIVLLCALLGAFKEIGADTAMNQLFALIATLCVVISLSGSILDCVLWASRTIEQTAGFMLAFIPVFSAAMVAAGQPLSGMAYNSFLFVTCQVVSQVIVRTLVPLLSVYLALCIVGALVPDLDISGIADGVKSIVSWGLGLLLTLFIALLSLQSMVSSSADGIALRTGKFLLGTFVPVVGGALSDAMGAAHGCLQLIKTTVGVYGIVVAIFTLLPVIVRILLWFGISNMAAMAGDFLGVPSAADLLKACAGVLGLLLAVVMCFGLLLIISTTVVIVTSLGV